MGWSHGMDMAAIGDGLRYRCDIQRAGSTWIADVRCSIRREDSSGPQRDDGVNFSGWVVTFQLPQGYDRFRDGDQLVNVRQWPANRIVWSRLYAFWIEPFGPYGWRVWCKDNR